MGSRTDELEILSSDLFKFTLIHDLIGEHFSVCINDTYRHEDILDTQCDTFTTGDLIYHLEKAVRKFDKSHHPILMSRWTPFVDKVFFTNISEDIYVTTKIYRDNDNDMVLFIVKLPSEEYGRNKMTHFYCHLDKLKEFISGH